MHLITVGVDMFLERRKTRLYVGRLTHEKKEFVFTYDDQYLRAKNVIPLGPEFPLTKRSFRSPSLFASLEDRIPSKQNPAYPDYCHTMGISPEETDALILLSTIGRRGPSWFVFEPVYARSFTVKETIAFRKMLGLTTRDFAKVFEIPQASLNALERGRSSGKDLLKRLELIVRIPEVALYLVMMNGGVLANDRRFDVIEMLQKQTADHQKIVNGPK